MKSKVAIISALLITTFGFNNIAEANDSLVEVINQQNQQENLIATRGRSTRGRGRSTRGRGRSTRGRGRSTQERGRSSRGTSYQVQPNTFRHIIDRHGRDGEGSKFPPAWDEQKILDAVESVANDRRIPAETRPNGYKTRTGTFDGIEMRVIIKSNGVIISGYPLEDHN